jgi:triacylglycerol lipase
MTWVPLPRHESSFTLPNRLSQPDMRTSNNVGATTLRTRTKQSPRSLSLNLSSDNMPALPPNSQQSPHRPPHPVLRWYGHTNPPVTSGSSTPSSTDSHTHPNHPPDSPMENLHDALTSSLPTPTPSTFKQPQKAVPPMFLSGSPSLLRSLPRVTLPIASLSSLAPIMRPFDPPVDPQSPGAPIFLQHSSPERSSLDFLRSLRDRRSGSSARPTRHTSRASLPSPGPSVAFSTSAAPSWWQLQNDNKENIDRLLSEEDRAPTVEEEQSRIHKKCAWPAVPYNPRLLALLLPYVIRVDLSPRHPIVFCHGLLGFDSVTIGPAIAPLEVTHWRGIKEVLQENGAEVFMTRVPATSSPEQRAKVLEQKIEEIYAGRSVHLLGTSSSTLLDHTLTSTQPRSQYGGAFHDAMSLTIFAHLSHPGWPRLPLSCLKTARPHLSHPLHHHDFDPTSRFLLC